MRHLPIKWWHWLLTAVVLCWIVYDALVNPATYETACYWDYF